MTISDSPSVLEDVLSFFPPLKCIVPYPPHFDYHIFSPSIGVKLVLIPC